MYRTNIPGGELRYIRVEQLADARSNKTKQKGKENKCIHTDMVADGMCIDYTCEEKEGERREKEAITCAILSSVSFKSGHYVINSPILGHPQPPRERDRRSPKTSNPDKMQYSGNKQERKKLTVEPRKGDFFSADDGRKRGEV